jgi:MurNAc alpha-1-phosphate uridylyltransferase
LGLDATGQVSFDDPQKPYVFTGAQILKTAPIAAMDIPKFGLRMLWETLAREGRLFGVIHQGGWADVGHPEGITSAEDLLATEKVTVT